MSRIDDLIDLIQTTNEVYLMNPSMNIRSAYIQIDDLCELSMKSFLQMNIQNWTPLKPNGQSFKSFRNIVNEINNYFSNRQDVVTLTTRIKDRRDNRNHFFHDPNQSGLTVLDKNGLEAFLDLYCLGSILFRSEFDSRINNRPLIKVQISIIKMKYKSYSCGLVSILYQEVVNRIGKYEAMPNSFGHECCTIIKDPISYYNKIEYLIKRKINDCNEEIDRINSLTRKLSKHREEIVHLQEQVILLQSIIDECL
ncbi:hypothetical protein [Acetivibrio mesophilus]|uniref:Uncharacterized protein n=1 Tax=Acetivibrio mesophilus TaxID=2487273 RepID=A0A4Q0I1T5_9FIRM|nr:hypothetical protein [Acetivibrio mesophilus]RXE57627.1 hypothetical protein EFD62_16660 [Acetivibrio mesophilus]